MTWQDRLLYHQIHPVKITTDVGAGIVSLTLLWQHRWRAALAVVAGPPAAVSLCLMACVDLEQYARSRTGRYVRRTQTPLVQAVRLGSFGGMMVAAWRRDKRGLAAGAAAVLACWSYGLISR